MRIFVVMRADAVELCVAPVSSTYLYVCHEAVVPPGEDYGLGHDSADSLTR